MFESTAPTPTWTTEQLAHISEHRYSWVRSGQSGVSPHWKDVEVGSRLPSCPIGPHTIRSFVTEYRSFIHGIWGATRDEFVGIAGLDAGWLPEMTRDYDRAKDDPQLGDGMYAGASRGHADPEAANVIGLPRAYGYGAVMGAWVLNHVGYWCGERGLIRHSKVQYRSPPFEGDVAILDGVIVDKKEDPLLGPLVTVEHTMTNQDGTVVAQGHLDVELP